MAYYVGDVPAEDLVIEPVRFGDPVDLTSFNEVEVAVTTFDGEPVETSGFTGTIDYGEQVVTLEWPDESIFTAAGMYAVNLTLSSSATSVRERVAPTYVVVHEDDGWHTVDTLRNEMGNDFSSDDAVIWTLLEVARMAVLAYAPTLPFLVDGVTPVRAPINYKLGQLMQARNIFNIAKTDPQTTDDTGMFVVRPYPLDNFIKQILRPKRGPLAFV